MADVKLLTSSEAAERAKVTRQAISLAAKAGQIGTRYGPIYMFTPEEIDAWKHRPRNPGGRPPKSNAGTMAQPSPALQP